MMRTSGIIGVCAIAFLALWRKPSIRASVGAALITEGTRILDELPDAPMRAEFADELELMLLDEYVLDLNRNHIYQGP